MLAFLRVAAGILVAASHFAWAVPATNSDFRGDVVYRVEPSSYEGFQQALQDPKLQNRLDLWSHDGDDEVHVRVPFDVLDYFNSLNFNQTVLIPDVGSLMAEQAAAQAEALDNIEQSDVNDVSASAAPAGFFTAFQSINSINAYLSSLATQFPNIITPVTIGTTYERRGIQGVRISGQGSVTNKKGIFIIGGEHAREWIGVSTVLYIIEQLTSNYATDTAIKNLVDGLEITIVPVLNADGYSYTMAAGGNRLWRKNRQPTAKAACPGIDINRNYGYQWQNADPQSADECSEVFKGTQPFQTAEGVAVRDYVNARGNILSFFDVHAYGQYWMSPYAYSTVLPKDYKLLNDLGTKAAAAVKASAGTVYTVGNVARVIYQAYGSSLDYTYSIQNVTFSYALELRDKGARGFLLPPTDIMPVGQETWDGILVSLKYIAFDFLQLPQGTTPSPSESSTPPAPGQSANPAASPSAGGGALNPITPGTSTQPQPSASGGLGASSSPKPGTSVSANASGKPVGKSSAAQITGGWFSVCAALAVTLAL